MKQMMGLVAAALLLVGCGGMNRAVGVLPNTMDDLGAKSAALRGERVPDAPQESAVAR